MIVNAMMHPAIRPEEKDRKALEKIVTVEAPKLAPLRWQSHLLLAAITPLCAGIVAWYAATAWTRSTGIALALSLAFSVTAWRTRAATPWAAIAALIPTSAMALVSNGAGGNELRHSALLPLLVLFLLTSGATRFGRSRKEGLGAAEDARGRNAAQIVANLGTAGLLASLALAMSTGNPGLVQPALDSRWMTRHAAALCAVMLIAALAEATADTLSSELGEVLGGKPWRITTGERVAPGSDGAISITGTLAGVAGAIVVVLVAVPTIGLTFRAALAAATGAVVGIFFDSLLGATAEQRGWLNNDAVNFLSTVAAALVAFMISAAWMG